MSILTTRGKQGKTTPAVGVEVMLRETGDSTRTKAGGLFRLFLPDAFRTGETVTLVVAKVGWAIQYPLDGAAHIPANVDKELVEVRLLPLGSKKFWSEERIEKFIQDTAEKAKQQVTLEGKPEDIDFSRYIKEWATQYGFSAGQAKAEIDKWVADVQQKGEDFYKLGLAAYAEKNFDKAGELFILSAETKAEQLARLQEKAAALWEETVRDFRLAGDAYYNNYAFEQALSAYQQAFSHVAREEHPNRWAALLNEIGSTHVQLGTRTSGPAVQEHFSEAVTAYRAALQVRTRAQLPQQWAMTQNNLGTALKAQGIRSGGEAGAGGNCQGNCRLDGLTHAAFSNASDLSLSSDLSGFKYTSSTGSQFRVSRLQRSGCRAFAAS